MEIRHFKLIASIANAGSLTRATDKLFLTQSALSHQLKEVEMELGCPLFKRVNKKLILTQAGTMFLDSSRIILAEVQSLTEGIKRVTDGESGTIRLATESSASYKWISKILKAFQQEYPNVVVDLNAGSTNKPVDLLLKGKVDMVIMHRLRHEKNIEYISLFTDEVLALVAATDKLADRKYLTPEDFKAINYITHSRNLKSSAFYEDFLQPYHAMPRKVTSVRHTEAIISMVEAGMGVAVMSNWLLTPYVNASYIKAMSLTKNGLRRKWCIGLLKGKRPVFVDRFVELLKRDIPTFDRK